MKVTPAFIATAIQSPLASGEGMTPPPFPTFLADRRRVRTELLWFFGLCFLLTWSIALILVMPPPALTARLGPVDFDHSGYREIFILACWVPSLTGIALTGFFGGSNGLRELFGRLFKWRVGVWWLFIGVGVPLLTWSMELMTHDLLHIARGAVRHELYPFGWFSSLFAGAIFLDPGPLGEEAGWRGFALPRLAALMPFWPANVVLGLIWGLWHIPAFLVATSNQANTNFGLFLVGAIALAVAMGAVYRATAGSVLVAGWLMHVLANQLGDIRNLAIDIVRYLLVAAIVVMLTPKFGIPFTLERNSDRQPTLEVETPDNVW